MQNFKINTINNLTTSKYNQVSYPGHSSRKSNKNTSPKSQKNIADNSYADIFTIYSLSTAAQNYGAENIQEDCTEMYNSIIL
jgi:hypothetical protein